MPEREQRKEKEKKKKSIYETFIEVMERLEEIVQKLKQRLRKQERETLIKEQEGLEGKKGTLITEFLETTEGKEVKKERDGNETKLKKAVDELKEASEEEYGEKKKTVGQLIEELNDEARTHRDSEKVIENHKGITSYELNRVIKENEKKRNEVLRKRGEPVKIDEETLEAAEAEERDKKRELKRKIGERSREIEQRLLKGKIDAKSVAELAKHQEVLRGLAEQRGSPYELTPKQQRAILSDEKEERDFVFEEILSRFGGDKNRHFREADLTAQSQWINFMFMLRDNPDVLEKYILRFGFEEYTHNLDLFFRGHSHPDKLPELLTNFQSPMLDVAVRQRGAAAAFRAYEQVFNRLFLTEGKLPAAKFFDPDTETSFIHNWTKEQVRETLTAEMAKKEGLSWEDAEAKYEKEILPFETTFMRTGFKIFVFTLRGDEIQASTIAPRQGFDAPWHEDMWRRLDPPGMPIKYWMQKYSAKDFLGADDQTKASSFYYFFSGGKEKQFRTIDDYRKAIKELEDKGEIQLNLFDIGGIFSKTGWRSIEATKHIPSSLARFLGIEMEYKLLTHGKGKMKDIDAKEKVLEHARVRNPFALFRLGDEEDQQAILRKTGLTLADLREEGGIYDQMAQALQRLVYEQQAEMKKILKPDKSEGEKTAAAEQFLRVNENQGLDFSFVTNVDQKDQLEGFVRAIENHFNPGGAYFKKLAEKRYPFSLGTEDVPLELMRFTEVGDVGLQRRFRDVGAAARATEAFWKLTGGLGQILQKKESIIEAIKEIQSPIEEYDGQISTNVALTVTDRVIEMLAEDDLQNWLPWPLNTLREKYGHSLPGFLSKYSSICKAEEVFGSKHMAMGSEDIRLLIDDLIAAGCFPTLYPREARKLLYDKHGVNWYNILWEKVYGYGPLAVIALPAATVIWIATTLKEDIEKEAEEL